MWVGALMLAVLSSSARNASLRSVSASEYRGMPRQFGPRWFLAATGYLFLAPSRVDYRSLVRRVIFSADSPVAAASDLISCATTAKPRPISPARVALDARVQRQHLQRPQHFQDVAGAAHDLLADLAEMIDHLAVLHLERLAIADRDDAAFEELELAPLVEHAAADLVDPDRLAAAADQAIVDIPVGLALERGADRLVYDAEVVRMADRGKARTRLPMKSLAGYSVSGVMPSVM